jgi:hypothetical protein
MFSAEAGFMCEQTHDASETEKTMKTRKNQMLELAAQRATRRIERDERQTRLGRAVDHEIKAMFAKPGNDEALAWGRRSSARSWPRPTCANTGR